ncbi:hypothetical protein F5884DRAFT_763153 [Xylogone sp. PMI_703]|nr:hypothetical protein F5884DRAFT_763153 [Xylogone sp. PMI_703]
MGIKHKSAYLEVPKATNILKEDSQGINSVYVPEVRELIRKSTGCKEVFILNVAVRDNSAKPPTVIDKPLVDCGTQLDPAKTNLNKAVLPADMNGAKLGPVRSVHIDFSPQGVQQMIRHARDDVVAHSQDIIAAEEAGQPARRYAMYSLWRPLRKITRDPIALIDPDSFVFDKELIEFVNRQPGISGDFWTGVHLVSPDAANQHKWYYIREQDQDEALLIQLYDSYARQEGRPIGTPHASPDMTSGIPEGGWRESIETRVMAFW